MFGSIVGSISKTFASPTEVERKVTAFKTEKLDIIEAMGKIFMEEGMLQNQRCCGCCCCCVVA